MNIEKTNNWIALAANLGVLIGLVIVAFELQQSNSNLELSNRIAIGSSAMQLTAMAQNVNLQFSDDISGKLLVQLTDASSSLTDSETIRALRFFSASRNYWNAAERAFENGLIQEEVFQIYLGIIENFFSTYPQVANILSARTDTMGMATQIARNTSVANSRVYQITLQSIEINRSK